MTMPGSTTTTLVFACQSNQEHEEGKRDPGRTTLEVVGSVGTSTHYNFVAGLQRRGMLCLKSSLMFSGRRSFGS